MTQPPDAVEQVFLDDIVAHPDDPSLWLILADWLEDRQDPRAELVRLTWSLQHEPRKRDFKVREARVQALLAGGMVPVRPRRTLGGFEFAWLPPGSFRMGSPKSEKQRGSNETLHAVTLTRGFWLAVVPVTQGQWRAVTGENPSYFSREGGGKDKVQAVSAADLELFPVESVSWDMAQEFCQKLSERLGHLVSLPTEAQWEYACRAGTTTPFHFGSVLNGAQANCNGNYPYGTSEKGPYRERPTPVGSYPANAWGLWDLHGNIWEWCQDAYREDYEQLPASDPLFEQDIRRVLRGGSWSNLSRYCRSANRNYFAPANRYNYFGLRMVVALP